MKKQFLSFVLILIILSIGSMASAEYPHALWKPLAAFEKALNAGDDVNILRYAQECVAIVEKMPDGSREKTEFLAGKYEQIARCHERLGNFAKALEYNKKYLPLATIMGWTDGVLFAENKIIALTPILNIYGKTTDDNTNIPYYGTKFEPVKGMYFGSTYDLDPRIYANISDVVREYFPKEESIYLIYLEWGDLPQDSPRFEAYFADAKKHGKAVEFAWNTYYPLGDIEKYDSYIDKVFDFISQSGVKVFLRFANEMNIGPNGDNKEDYIKSFRYIADRARNNPNIAMIWAPNDMGAINRPFIDYYPGDSYVDWIGISSYNIRYFYADVYTGSNDINNTFFFTNEYANPIKKAQKIVDFMTENNINKPIILSECGSPHTFNTKNDEDITDFGRPLFYSLYAELPKYYPQIKAILYFNTHMANEHQDYSIYNNHEWQNIYNKVVSDDYYISKFGENASVSYKEIKDSVRTDSLSAVFYVPKSRNTTIAYYYDGEFSNELPIPYEWNIPKNAGEHFIEVRAICDGVFIDKLNYKSIDGVVSPAYSDGSIAVVLNGQRIQFPNQQPMIADGRTLVPLRGVMESMGAVVDWNNETQEIMITRGDIKIVMQIGNTIMRKNTEEITTDVAPQLINSNTMIPLRAVSEAINAKVSWVEGLSTVVIYEKN